MPSFDWKEFLNLAHGLKGRSGSGYSVEAADRSAVSRAYYAAFCRARNYAASQQGFTPTQKAKDHQLLFEHFARLGNEWNEVAEDLDDLRKWRNKCDYEDHVDNLHTLADAALENARRVLERFR